MAPQNSLVNSNTFLQWNIRGLRSNNLELKNLISLYNPICLALNETKINDPSSLIQESFKNYSPYFINNDTFRGNLILIRKDIPFSAISLTTNLNVLAIKLIIDGKALYLCSIYLNPSFELDPQALSGIITQLPEPFILMGDFNARSEYWHDSVSNKRGNQILDIILHHNLHLLNDDKPTHLDPRVRSLSHIDLSLCSQTLAPELGWRTHVDLCGSDHFPILVDYLNMTTLNARPHWKYYRANWPMFTDDTKVIQYNHREDLDVNLENFTASVYASALKFIPLSKPSGLRTCAPWWNDDCKAAKRQRNRALRKFLKTKDQVDYIEYKRLRAVSRRVFREAKTQSWKNFVSSINTRTPLGKIWKKVNKLKGSSRRAHIPSLNIDGQVIDDPTLVADCLGASLSSAS